MAYNFPDSPFAGDVYSPSAGPTWEFGGGVWRQAVPLIPPVAGAFVLDVTMYGATGDGVTDDQPAIQAALDAAVGRSLFFPRGDYYVARACNVRSGTTVFGEGYGSRIMLPLDGWVVSTGDTYAALTVVGTELEEVVGVRITNLRFRGLESGVPAARACKPIFCYYTRSLKIDHCWFEDHAWEAIWGSGGATNREVLVANCYFTRCGKNPEAFVGLTCIQPNGRDGLIIGNTMIDVGCGIGNVGWNMTTVGNLIDGCTLIGIMVGDGHDHYNHIISGNSVRISGLNQPGLVQGILINGGNLAYGGHGQVNVTGNTVRVDGTTYSNGIGIRMDGGRHANIGNNTVEVIGRGTGILVDGIPSGAKAVVRNNTVQGINQSGLSFGITAVVSTATTLTIHSMGNYVYGFTRAHNSYAYDFRTVGTGIMKATSSGDLMEDGYYRMKTLQYSGGELDNVPITLNSDMLTTHDSFDLVAKVGLLSFGPRAPLIYIAGGVVAINITTANLTLRRTRLLLDTEGTGPTDDLDTINGTQDGDILIIAPNADTRTIVAKDGTGNLRLAGDFAMDHTSDRLLLISDGTLLYELSRSDNGT